eukprot:1582491-Rhodomonas_salina.5
MRATVGWARGQHCPIRAAVPVRTVEGRPGGEADEEKGGGLFWLQCLDHGTEDIPAKQRTPHREKKPGAETRARDTVHAAEGWFWSDGVGAIVL